MWFLPTIETVIAEVRKFHFAKVIDQPAGRPGSGQLVTFNQHIAAEGLFSFQGAKEWMEAVVLMRDMGWRLWEGDDEKITKRFSDIGKRFGGCIVGTLNARPPEGSHHRKLELCVQEDLQFVPQGAPPPPD